MPQLESIMKKFPDMYTAMLRDLSGESKRPPADCCSYTRKLVQSFSMEDGIYELNFKKQPNDGAHVLSAKSLAEIYREFMKDFPKVSIEAPFDQDDWSSWASLQSFVNMQLVGDDLSVTNLKRIAEAINKRSCNALFLKVNQIGTVTESIQAAHASKAAIWGVMVSHWSGELISSKNYGCF